MPNQDRRTILPRQHALGRGYRLGQRGQGILHGGDVQSPAACKRGITSDQEEPSANSPCTSTTLRAFSAVAFAAMPRVEINEAAAPSRVVEKTRLFIIMILFLHRKG